jgi:phenylpyruvate tautomerase PptA (4-oxalocrotonate tautomerase family)
MLNLKCSKRVPDELLAELSAAVAETIGKPEKYVMVAAESAEFLMSGEKGDAAYAEIKSIGGLDRVVNHELTIKICVLLNDHLGIASDRIYITCQSVAADHWGWNQSIFG